MNAQKQEVINQKYDTFSYEKESMKPYAFKYDKKHYDVLGIKANLGVGKTEELYNLIPKYNKVAIISFRISLDRQYSRRLDNFKLYLDINQKDYDTDKYNKMIIQIDSFHKICGDLDLLVIDEVTYTMSQLVYSKKRDKNYEALNQYLRNKKTKIVLLDALLEKDTIEVFCNYERRVLMVENTYKKHTDLLINSYGNDYASFKNRMLNDLYNNKKIVFATNSKSELDYIESQIRDKFKNDKKTMFIHVDNNDFEINEWKNLDFLGYTPTISAGVSFVEKHFDNIYGYFVNGSATAEVAVQQLFRVRNINEKQINICVDITNGDKYPVDDSALDEHIIEKNKILCKYVDFIKINHIKKEIIKDDYYYWYKSVIRKEYISYNNYLKRIINLLKTQGVNKINFLNDKKLEDNKIARKLKREHTQEMNDQNYKDIYNSERLTFNAYDELKDKIKKTKQEKNSCKRFSFLNKTKIQESEFSPEVYKKNHRHLTKLSNLAYIYLNKIDINSKLYERFNKTIERFNFESNVNRLHESKRIEKLIICFDLINTYGFDVNKFFEYTKEFTIKLDKNKIKDYVINNYKKIDFAFGVANKNWDDILSKDNWFVLLNRYVNTKLTSMLKITLKIKKINKEDYIFINGLDHWDVVKYNNPLILNEIQNSEFNYYYKTDKKKEQKEFDNKVLSYQQKLINEGMDTLDAYIESLKILTEEKEEIIHHEGYESPMSYFQDYKNKPSNLCILCNNEINRWLLEENINKCEDCHWQ